MDLGSIYLIVNDFEKSITFYEKVLEIPVTKRNMDRFAEFHFEGHSISLMNGHFDRDNPDKVIRKGNYDNLFDDFYSKAIAPNTHKFVLNFWDEDLSKEYQRIKELNITENLSQIGYIFNVAPYYSFSFTDPDDNIIEVAGNYVAKDGEFDD